MTLPEVLFLDATPDEGYPLRILKAYRQQCDCRWSTTTDADGTVNPVLDPAALEQMNKDNDKRAEILDRAIALLEAIASAGSGR